MWKIENYFDWVKVNGNRVKKGSPVFKLLGEEEYRYYVSLELYPDGDSDQARGYVWLYLRNETEEDIQLHSQFFILGRNGSKYEIVGSYSRTYSSKLGHHHNNSWGYRKAIASRLIKWRHSFYLDKGAITFGADVIFSFEESSFERMNLNQQPPNEFSKRFSIVYSALNEDVCTYDNFFPEVFIVSKQDGNKKRFPCHKHMLFITSSVFNEMLQYSSPDDNEIKVTEDAPTIKSFLCYIYSDRIKPESIDTKLFIASDKYDLENLKLTCEEYFLKSLTVNKLPGNYFEVQTLAFINAFSSSHPYFWFRFLFDWRSCFKKKFLSKSCIESN